MCKEEKQRRENIFIRILRQPDAKGFARVVVLASAQPCELNTVRLTRFAEEEIEV